MVTLTYTKGKNGEKGNVTSNSIGAKTMALGKKLGKKVVDKTSDAMSIVPRLKAENSKKKSDYELGVINKHRIIKKYGTDDRRPARDPNSAMRTVTEYNRIKREHGFK